MSKYDEKSLCDDMDQDDDEVDVEIKEEEEEEPRDCRSNTKTQFANFSGETRSVARERLVDVLLLQFCLCWPGRPLRRKILNARCESFTHWSDLPAPLLFSIQLNRKTINSETSFKIKINYCKWWSRAASRSQ